MAVVKVFLKILDYIEEIAIVVLLTFMTVMNFVNVVSRYCFSNSFSFTEELTIMAFVWSTFLAAAVGYKRNAHLGMSFIVDQFPKKYQAYFALFSMVCSLLLVSVMIKYGVSMVQGQIMLNGKTPALRLPTAMQGLSIPVGGALIGIRSLQAGIVEFRRLRAEGRMNGEGGAES